MADLRILCFHRVISEPGPGDAPYLARGSAISAGDFAQAIDHIARTHTFWNEDDVVRWLDAGRPRLHRPACWLTFDDGYADVLSVAAPLLAARGLRPSLFYTTGLLEGGWRLPVDTWYATLMGARRRRVVLSGLGSEPRKVDLDDPESMQTLLVGPEKEMFIRSGPVAQRDLLTALRALLDAEDVQAPPVLTSGDLTTLSEMGWSIGSHGHRHLLLEGVDETVALHELTTATHVLQSLSLRPSRFFAWPDGRSDERSREVAIRLQTELQVVGALALGFTDVDADQPLFSLPRWIGSSECAPGRQTGLEQAPTRVPPA